MAITSDDIRNKILNIERKGYDVPETDDFLDAIADEIDALNAEIARLQNELAAALEAAPATSESEQVVDLDAALAEPAPAQELAADGDKDARIAELEKHLADKRAEDNAIAEALVAATRSAQEVTQAAEENARKIQNDAQSSAEGILERANAEREQIEDKISDLEDTHIEFCEDYASVLRGFIDDAQKRLEEITSEISRTQGNHARARESRPATPQNRPFIQAPATASQQVDVAADFDMDDID